MLHGLFHYYYAFKFMVESSISKFWITTKDIFSALQLFWSPTNLATNLTPISFHYVFSIVGLNRTAGKDANWNIDYLKFGKIMLTWAGGILQFRLQISKSK